MFDRLLLQASVYKDETERDVDGAVKRLNIEWHVNMHGNVKSS